MRQLSKKLSSKLLSLLDPEEQHGTTSDMIQQPEDAVSASSGISTVSLPDLSRQETVTKSVKQASGKCGLEVSDYLICNECHGYYCSECGHLPVSKNSCSTAAKHTLREPTASEGMPSTVFSSL
jgi:hypothetical protein